MGMDDSVMYKGVLFKTGDDISLVTRGKIVKGKIYVCDSIETTHIGFTDYHPDNIGCYICQDEKDGMIGPNLLGYKYSYVFSIYNNGSSLSSYVSNLIKLDSNPFQSYDKIISNAFPTKE